MGDSTEEDKGGGSEQKPAEPPVSLNGHADSSLDGGYKAFKLSDESQALIDAGRELLGYKSSAMPTLRPISPPITPLKPRCASPDEELIASSSHIPRRLAAPRLLRKDFSDSLLDEVSDRLPASKQLHESVKDSYYKAKRTADRGKDEYDFMEGLASRPVGRQGKSPFRELEGNGYIPARRYPSTNPLLQQSGSSSNPFTHGSGPYAAPAVSRSQGIESTYRKPTEYEKLYDRRATEVESRLIASSVLPNIRSITAREFRRAPEPAAGSASDQHDLDDYDFSSYAPRPYYSRPNKDDPDYFDYDLQHSVDLYKRPEGKYTPRGSKPHEWETKLLSEASAKGSAPISGYLFTKGDTDWRQNNSSYLSAALRTPKFWEQRFMSIGSQVRDSNPISLESINRNKPVPSRFTEYRDPDFEDYEDPRADD
ncbi:unnamed protein product, partial [Mesorhabditis spiculigera]